MNESESLYCTRETNDEEKENLTLEKSYIAELETKVVLDSVIGQKCYCCLKCYSESVIGFYG